MRLLLGIAECYKKTGNYQTAVQWLEKGLLYEPLHRELNYRLVETLLLTHNGDWRRNIMSFTATV